MDDKVLYDLFEESVNVTSESIDDNRIYSASYAESLVINDHIETGSEANDLLKNGILIETREGVKLLSLTDALSSGLNLSVEDIHNVATQLLSNQPSGLLDVQPKPLESISEVADEIVSHPILLEDFGHHFLVNDGIRKNVTDLKKKTRNVSSTITSGDSVTQASSPLAEAFKNAFCDDAGLKQEVKNEASRSRNVNIPYSPEAYVDVILNENVNNENQQSYAVDKFSENPPLNILTPEESVSESSSAIVGVSESANSDSSVQSCHDKVRRKGGWPKGRKRKPELYENRPPKAPATGYVFYLNEKRKLHKNVPFPEVTKLLGNEWSNLSLEEKRAYLECAEVDKRRYREELRAYRKSEAYQSYLRRKRLKSLQANGTEESDVELTDEEDNEELYCRVCDQWFVTLHNKKEHLHGRQHFQNISQFQANCRDGRVSSLDESSLDGSPVDKSWKASSSNEASTMSDAIVTVFQLQADREKEIQYLKQRLKNQVNQYLNFNRIIKQLELEEHRLNRELDKQKRFKQETERKISKLWEVLNV
ncbi:hypothetical protein LSTR_LSTR002003 [Laodelphax striatellus]|uniref:HMG box domain-containing protein n=1 Tax=Laodelphax striatellus TaxID=195883 RepID=A0A482XH12_LAOST|nr:hypothetical protein LSTR_LSTR002003 [Laodelphax striatellus]